MVEYDTVFVGAGNMGGAILRGALESGALAPADVLVIDAAAERRRAFEQLGVRTSTDLACARHGNVVVLAVKPQSFPEVAAGITPLDEDVLVVSVMAGIDSETISDALGGEAGVVRAMPNTPAQVRHGITAIAMGDGADEEDLVIAQALFAPVGAVVEVDEEELDAVTAVSGSGPAYLFHLAEHWIAGARALGLDEETARELVLQTIRGASILLEQPGADPTGLREAVTSPGGTTAAALAVLEEHGFGEALQQALRAACERARELSS